MASGSVHRILPAVVFGLLSVVTVGPWVQSSALAQGATAAGGQEIARQEALGQLLQEARREMITGNPQGTEEKCQQVLQYDPDNAEALLLLSQVERLRKGAVSTGPRSPVSTLPSGANLSEAVARARPTTVTIVMPSERASSSAGPLRPAVVDGSMGDVAPSVTPVWLSRRYLMWIALGLLGVILFLVVLMVLDRLLSAKRHQAAQDQFFEQMRSASDDVPESPVGDSAPDTTAFDDFPVAVPISTDPLEATMPIDTGPAIADNVDADYWEEEEVSPQPPSPAAATPTTADTSSPLAEGGESEVIPADKAFAEEVFGVDSASSAEAWPSPAEETLGAPEGLIPTSPAAGEPPATGALGESPVPAAAPGESDEEPISLDGISVQSPVIEDFEESEEIAREASVLRPTTLVEDVQIEPTSPEAGDAEIPFSLDMSVDQTDTQVGSDATGPSGLESIDAPLPEGEPSARVEGDFSPSDTGEPDATPEP